MADYLPVKDVGDPEVIEPEIVGVVRPAGLWQRIATRAAAGAILAFLALACLCAGALLTITLIGAAVGIPLIFVGFAFLIAAFVVFFGGGKALFQIRRLTPQWEEHT